MVFAFLWLCVSEICWATKREDLERAAELAVERAAERAAERAVEKALESGNSTTESETIRESYSSVRKYDKSLQLPRSGYTPAERHEYDRIIREREAAERASALLKRSVDNSRVDVHQVEEENNDGDTQQRYYKNLPEVALPATYHVTRQLPVPVGGYESTYATVSSDGQHYQQRLPSVNGYGVRDGNQFSSLYPVKVFAVQTTKPYPLRAFHVEPATETGTDSSVITAVTYPHSVDHDRPIHNHHIFNQNLRRSGQGWIY